MAQPKFISAFDLFGKSATIIRDNLMPYALVLVLPTVMASFGDDGVRGLITVLGLMLTVAFLPALTKLYLLTAKGKEPTVSEIFNGSYRYFWRLIGVSLLVGLAIVVGVILFIIPGLIMLRRYSVSAFLLMDKDMKILDAMNESARITKPFSWKIYSVFGVVLLIGIVSSIGAVGFVIGTILGILYSAAVPLRYYELLKANKLKAGDKY